MDEFRVTGLSEFSELVLNRYMGERKGTWVFRGHSRLEYELVPSIGRITHTSRSFEKFESSVFNMFRRNAGQHISSTPTNDFEWLALAQHHGLPTRLLDWTFNPSVALFFAVCNNHNKDCSVFALRAEKRISDLKVASLSPFGLDKLYKYIPSSVTPRLFAQEGFFTVHPEPVTPLEVQKRDDWTLEKIIVPNIRKSPIQYVLFRQGVDRAHLLPDLDGLCSNIKWQHTVSADALSVNPP